MTTKIKLASNVSDVDLTTTAPTNGQGLIYNSTSSKWVPGAAGGGVTSYASIDDLPLSGNAEGDLALVQVAAAPNMLYIWSDSGWYNIAIVNTDPKITAGNNTPYLLALDGTPTVITLTASDPEGIPLTWSYEVTSGSLTNGGGTTATVSNDGGGQFTVTPTTTEAYAGEFSLTFKASDGVNLGTTVAAFTLAFRVVDSKYTSLLVKALASGANSTFVDSSTNNFTITKNGDVTQGTFSPFSQPELNWSTYLNGASHFQSPVNSAIAPTTDTTWTIEFMAFVQDFSNNPIVMAIGVYGSNINSRVSFNTSGNLEYYSGSNTWGYTATATSSSAMTANKWHHCVLVRDAGSLMMYIDGTEVYNASFNFGSGNTGYIFFGSYFGQASQSFNGYLSNFRYTKSNVYSGTVTAPINGLDVLTNTSLLVSQKNRFVDSAGTVSLTLYGSPAVSPFGPFDRLAYDPAVHGGGAYFDGSGDYLATPTSTALSLGTGAFTVEGWAYCTANANQYSTIISNYTTWGASQVVIFSSYNNGGHLVAYIGNGFSIDAGVMPFNRWMHIALVRTAGGVATLYVDGIATGTPITNSADVGGAQAFWLGAAGDAPTTTGFSGHMSNWRVVKGTALYTSNFSPATAPFTQTSQGATATEVGLLLNCVNANIIDNDSKGNLTPVGNTAASATQTKYAARSVYFDGAGDYLLGNDITLGSADFTIECWWYTGSTSRQAILHGSNGYDWSYAIDYNSRGNYKMGIWASSTGSSWNLANADAGGNGIGSATIAQNTWTHIAFVRNGTVLRLYVNGTLDVEITGVSAAVATRPSNQPIIGMWFNGTQYANSGYIEDLRITKGLARYTANFTPPTSELLG